MVSLTIRLTESLKTWATPHFDSTLKRELESLPITQLPLQACLNAGSHVLDEPHNVIILSVTQTLDIISVKIGVMYNSIIAGCHCADDPTPVDSLNEYCELLVTLDMENAGATFHVVD